MARTAIPTPDVPAGDFELYVKEVTVSRGRRKVSVTEMTLQQRDRFMEYLDQVTSDGEIASVLGPLLDGESADVDVVSIARTLLRAGGAGAITSLLAIVLDCEENESIWEDAEGENSLAKCLAWIPRNVGISDETTVFDAFLELNDITAYLKNWWGRVPKMAAARAQQTKG